MGLIQEIQGATSDERVQLSLLMGALLEGGSLQGPWQPGDNGTSFGPFQIHLPAHPDFTAQSASDPHAAIGWALPAYSDAVRQVPDALWLSDPKAAAAQTAFIAERPAYMYPADRVNGAWSALTGAAGTPDFVGAQGAGGPGIGGLPGVFPVDFWKRLIDTFGPGSGPANIAGGAAEKIGDAGSGTLDALKPIGAFFVKAADPHTWAKFGLTLAAAALIIMGIVLVARPKALPVPVPV